MGILIGLALGPFFAAILVGVFLKLVLDVFSNALTGQPFKYLGWPATVLLIVLLMVAGYYITGDINLAANPNLVDWLWWSTMIGFVTLPILAIYGLSRKLRNRKRNGLG